MRIVLASASPRRRELLKQIGLEFEVKVSDVEEKVTATLPYEVVLELAGQKARAVLGTLAQEEKDPAKQPDAVLVIGADTVVSCDDVILGKPADEKDAERMLGMLRARAHEVYTGVALLYCPKGCALAVAKPEQFCVARTFYEATKVHFAPMTEAEIKTYVSTKDPSDKAGAYGIQGFCARYITRIEGDYNNVVGLPVGRLYQEAKEWL